MTKEASVTFKSTSNLVPVTVVVRDGKGHAIGNLGREDFQLFDNGKPQVISKFTVEKLSKDADAVRSRRSSDKSAAGETLVNAGSDGIPDRFVAYLFDDLHLSYADLKYTREAARRQIDSSVHPLERFAIYTTSGQHMTDFTGDRDKLHNALDQLNAGQAAASNETQVRACPPVTYYMGDLIYNSNNAAAMAIALADAAACAPGMTGPVLATMVQNAARDAVSLGDRETLWALDALHTVVNKMAAMSGQRSIALVSPGFLVLSDRLPQETALIERAIKANVVIGALDARGLYTMIPGGDASTRGNPSPSLISAKISYKTSETLAQSGHHG